MSESFQQLSQVPIELFKSLCSRPNTMNTVYHIVDVIKKHKDSFREKFKSHEHLLRNYHFPKQETNTSEVFVLVIAGREKLASQNACDMRCEM